MKVGTFSDQRIFNENSTQMGCDATTRIRHYICCDSRFEQKKVLTGDNYCVQHKII